MASDAVVRTRQAGIAYRFLLRRIGRRAREHRTNASRDLRHSIIRNILRLNVNGPVRPSPS